MKKIKITKKQQEQIIQDYFDKGYTIEEEDIVTENVEDTTKNLIYFEVVFINNGFKLKDKKGKIYDVGLKPIVVGDMFQNSDL